MQQQTRKPRERRSSSKKKNLLLRPRLRRARASFPGYTHGVWVNARPANQRAATRRDWLIGRLNWSGYKYDARFVAKLSIFANVKSTKPNRQFLSRKWSYMCLYVISPSKKLKVIQTMNVCNIFKVFTLTSFMCLFYLLLYLLTLDFFEGTFPFLFFIYICVVCVYVYLW